MSVRLFLRMVILWTACQRELKNSTTGGLGRVTESAAMGLSSNGVIRRGETGQGRGTRRFEKKAKKSAGKAQRSRTPFLGH